MADQKAYAARLETLLREMRRARFGPRSEKLHPDQLALALEEIETAIAEAKTGHEKRPLADKAATADAPKRPKPHRALPADLPRIERVIEPENRRCACGCGCGEMGQDRRGPLTPARRRACAVPRAGHDPTALRLPEGPGGRRPGAGAGAPDRGRPADRGADGTRHGRQVLRAHAVVSPEPGSRPPRRDGGPLDAGGLGGRRRLASAPDRGPDGRASEALGQALHGRDHDPGARPWPRQDQDRLPLGDGAG